MTDDSPLDQPAVDQPVLLDLSDGIATITLNRPDAMNSLDVATKVMLLDVLRQVADDPAARCVVLTGTGRAFCTGQDLKEHISILRSESSESLFRTVDEHYNPIVTTLAGMAKPVIAAVNGVCAGAGLHFVADADIVIAARDATFLDPHVSVGQVSAFETIALIRKSPMEAIARMALVGRHERMTAARAYELGILSQVVDPPARLRDTAQALGETIAINSPEALLQTKQLLWRVLEST